MLFGEKKFVNSKWNSRCRLSIWHGSPPHSYCHPNPTLQRGQVTPRALRLLPHGVMSPKERGHYSVQCSGTPRQNQWQDYPSTGKDREPETRGTTLSSLILWSDKQTENISNSLIFSSKTMRTNCVTCSEPWLQASCPCCCSWTKLVVQDSDSSGAAGHDSEQSTGHESGMCSVMVCVLIIVIRGITIWNKHTYARTHTCTYTHTDTHTYTHPPPTHKHPHTHTTKHIHTQTSTYKIHTHTHIPSPA